MSVSTEAERVTVSLYPYHFGPETNQQPFVDESIVITNIYLGVL